MSAELDELIFRARNCARNVRHSSFRARAAKDAELVPALEPGRHGAAKEAAADGLRHLMAAFPLFQAQKAQAALAIALVALTDALREEPDPPRRPYWIEREGA